MTTTPQRSAIITDSLVLDKKSARRVDENGYLHVTDCNLSKAQVRRYLGSELQAMTDEPLGLDDAKVYGMFCSPEELATVVGISRSLFFERMNTDPEVKEAVERGRDKGKTTLRRLQWQGAQEGNSTMLVWLGKQLLGQRDNLTIAGDASAPLIVTTGVPRLDAPDGE